VRTKAAGAAYRIGHGDARDVSTSHSDTDADLTKLWCGLRVRMPNT
jgi:hypothetical protein